MPGIAVVALFLPLLFPDGHLPSPRWKPAAYFAGVNVVLAVILTMLAPATYAETGYPSIRNPIGLDRYAAVFDTIATILQPLLLDRKSTRLNSSHEWSSYAVFCLKKKNT